MMEIAHPIKINLPAKMQDKDYRQKFFLAESSARLAEQITALRKRRGLNQKQLAEKVDTKQPAISRVEQADYQNWNFGTVQKIVGALDGRIRVLIEASEDVLPEYEEQSGQNSEQLVDSENTDPKSLSRFLMNVLPTNWGAFQFALGNRNRVDPQLVNNSALMAQTASKNAENARLRAENAFLKQENLALRAAVSAMPSLPDNRPAITDLMGSHSMIPAVPWFGQSA
jgi:transcriptional regulator with XRE-family HTH domain